MRLKTQQPSLSTLIYNIIASVYITCNSTTLVVGPFIIYFTSLKAFKVKTRHPKSHQIKEII